MKWLAKINLHTFVQKLGVYKSFIIVLTLIVICVFSGYRLGNYFHAHQIQAISYHKKTLALLDQQLADQIKRINTLSAELEIEKMANKQSLASLKSVGNENFELKKSLAFYERIMAPEKEADGVVLDEFLVSETAIKNRYNFNTLLVHQRIQKRYAKGFIDISVKGVLNNKTTTFSLADLSELSKKDLTFSFKYFQSIHGVFNLPEDFVPEKIHVIITLPKSRWQKYHRLEKGFKWSEKLEH